MQKLDISQPSFIKGVNQLLKTVPLADWRLYFKFHLLDDYAPYLSAQFADLEFDFHERTLNGVQEQKPRWRLAVESMDGNMGELLGKHVRRRRISRPQPSDACSSWWVTCSRPSTLRSMASIG